MSIRGLYRGVHRGVQSSDWLWLGSSANQIMVHVGPSANQTTGVCIGVHVGVCIGMHVGVCIGVHNDLIGFGGDLQPMRPGCA